MNQDYKQEEFSLSSDKEKKIIIEDDTGNDGGNPKPDPASKNSQEPVEEDDAE